jgi:RNA polymerase sigma-70 factor (ECF subfamily)
MDRREKRLAGWAAAATSSAALDLPGALPGVPGEDEPAGLDAAMDRYARGDDEAFDEVFRQGSPRVLGFLLRVCGDRTLAEDLTQEAFSRIHRARGRFIAGSAALPWMFAIARHALLDNWRREEVRRGAGRRDPAVAEVQEAPPDSRGDEVLSARETLDLVRRTLDRIPRIQREAFVLLRFEGLSVREAAHVLGATESAVKLRAFGAYEALRSALDLEGEGSSRRK